MAAAHVKAVKKLTRVKSNKPCWESSVGGGHKLFDRVCREARGTFSFYFESSLVSEVDRLVSSVLFWGFIKRCSDTFFNFFFFC